MQNLHYFYATYLKFDLGALYCWVFPPSDIVNSQPHAHRIGLLILWSMYIILHVVHRLRRPLGSKTLVQPRFIFCLLVRFR